MTERDDLAALAAIHAASFGNPRPWTEEELRALAGGPGVFLLTRDDAFLMGRAVAGEAELLTLAVLPGARRRGHGTALLAGFLAESVRRGAATAFLEVAADNTAALSLYARHGFTEVGRRRGYYRDAPGAAVDALVLRRALAPETQEI